MITLGGNAELELVDSMDPFSEGIIFSVMPPKKSWKNISNLSGGEKVSWPYFPRHSRLTDNRFLDTQFPCFGVRSTCLQGEFASLNRLRHGLTFPLAYSALLHG